MNQPTDATKLPELLPCPFCGAEAELDSDVDGNGSRVYRAQCTGGSLGCGCDALAPCAHMDEWEARKVWNRRAHMDARAGRTAAPVVTEDAAASLLSAAIGFFWLATDLHPNLKETATGADLERAIKAAAALAKQRRDATSGEGT